MKNINKISGKYLGAILPRTPGVRGKTPPRQKFEHRRWVQQVAGSMLIHYRRMTAKVGSIIFIIFFFTAFFIFFLFFFISSTFCCIASRGMHVHVLSSRFIGRQTSPPRRPLPSRHPDASCPNTHAAGGGRALLIFPRACLCCPQLPECSPAIGRCATALLQQ